MFVLVACEESQVVCSAYRFLGHSAFSCDILPCSGGHPEWHIMGDVLPILDGCCSFSTQDGKHHSLSSRWDLVIGFPPCTYLTNAGNRHFSLLNSPAEMVVDRWRNRALAAVFFLRIYFCDCDHVAVENPVGFMNLAFRKPDQVIHPYYFASSVSDSSNYVKKRTCLWLRGLPPLERVSFLPEPPPLYFCQGAKCFGKPIGWCEGISSVLGVKSDRSVARSKTFAAVGSAMASQWNNF